MSSWRNAGFAHLTTFSHAKVNGFETAWNIDADDTQICLSPERTVEFLQAVESYAVEHAIDAFSLDMWRTYEFGRHWSFGIVFNNNSFDWLAFAKSHCEDAAYVDQYESVTSRMNLDWYFTYLASCGGVRLETFYADELRFIHHSNDTYITPAGGLCFWKNGRKYLPVLCNECGLGESGSLPIASDCIKLDFDATDEDSATFFRSQVIDDSLRRCLRIARNEPDKLLSIIVFVSNAEEYISACLQSLFLQADQDFEIILIDDASDDGTLKLVRRMSEMFRGRMRIIQNETPRGLSESLNAGLRASSGKYVLLLDCADLLQPNFTQLFCDVAERMRADVLQTARHLSPPPDAKKYRNGMPLSLVKTIDVADNTAVLVPDGEQARRGLWENVFKRNVGSVKLIRREFLFRNKIFFAGNDEESARAGFELQCLLRANRYGLIANYSHIHQQR